MQNNLRTYTKYDEKGEKLNWKDAVAEQARKAFKFIFVLMTVN